MRLRPFALFLTSAVLVLAENANPGGWSADEDTDVDRTDFSEPHLTEDKPVVGAEPTGPSHEIESMAFMPDLADETRVPVGTGSNLLISLANLGLKMYNVTSVSGSVLDLESGAKVASFKKKVFGESLPPMEQRSYLYTFVPKAETKLGQYGLVFSIFYQTKKDMEPYVDVVFNQTIELVAKPPEAVDIFLYLAIGGGFVLLLVTAYLAMSSSAPQKAAGAGGKATPASKTPKAGDEKSDWLSGTLAGTENQHFIPVTRAVYPVGPSR